MIEDIIINALKTDSALKSLISKYKGLPSIFSELAPEDAIFPYVTFSINRNREDSVIQNMLLNVDFWDTNSTRVGARSASERIEYLLDNKIFEEVGSETGNKRYSTIRIYFSSGGIVDDNDPRVVHYNQIFTIRATRSKWIKNL